MQDINFVRQRQKALSKAEVGDQKLFRWSLVVLSVAVVVMIVAAVTQFFFTLQVGARQKEVDALNGQIGQMKPIEGRYLLLMKKAGALTSLFEQRREKQEALAYFSSLFDAEIIVSELSYTADTHTLTFTLLSPSVFSLNKIFDTLKSANVKERYPTFSIKSIGRGEDGSYGMGIVLPMKRDLKPAEVASASASQSEGESAPSIDAP